MSRPLPPLTGRKFGLLTVTGFDGYHVKTTQKRPYWQCLCECGTAKAIAQNNLVSGQVTSCGCGNGNPESRQAKHKREFGVWSSMKGRCRNPNDYNYHKYGARGISVCERWLNFDNFYADMGPRPDGTTLDRINNDGNYEPGNCRWATPTEQAFNTRRNRPFTHNGITMSMTQWADTYGIKRGTLWQRIEKGWDFETALTRAPHMGKSEVPGRYRGYSAGREPPPGKKK